MGADTYIAGGLMIAGSALAAVGGLVAVRRSIDPRTLRACHEVGGYLLSVVGTLYAVLLGLVVVDAMGTFQEAHQAAEQEANALSDVVVLAGRRPSGAQGEIVARAAAYGELVAGPEWDEMGRGRGSAEAERAARELVDAVLGADEAGVADDARRDAQVAAALELWNARRCRVALGARGIPAAKWAVLILGGIITVFFTYFFVIDDLRVQALMTSLIAVSIALNVFLVAMFGYPYSGDLRVDPSCYRGAGVGSGAHSISRIRPSGATRTSRVLPLDVRPRTS